MKNSNILVLFIKEISRWQQLNSPPRLRIQGGLVSVLWIHLYYLTTFTLIKLQIISRSLDSFFVEINNGGKSSNKFIIFLPVLVMVQSLVRKLSLLNLYLEEHYCIITFICAGDINKTAEIPIWITGLIIYTSQKNYLKISLNKDFFK